MREPEKRHLEMPSANGTVSMEENSVDQNQTFLILQGHADVGLQRRWLLKYYSRRQKQKTFVVIGAHDRYHKLRKTFSKFYRLY